MGRRLSHPTRTPAIVSRECTDACEPSRRSSRSTAWRCCHPWTSGDSWGWRFRKCVANPYPTSTLWRSTWTPALAHTAMEVWRTSHQTYVAADHGLASLRYHTACASSSWSSKARPSASRQRRSKWTIQNGLCKRVPVRPLPSIGCDATLRPCNPETNRGGGSPVLGPARRFRQTMAGLCCIPLCNQLFQLVFAGLSAKGLTILGECCKTAWAIGLIGCWKSFLFLLWAGYHFRYISILATWTCIVVQDVGVLTRILQTAGKSSHR